MHALKRSLQRRPRDAKILDINSTILHNKLVLPLAGLSAKTQPNSMIKSTCLLHVKPFSLQRTCILVFYKTIYISGSAKNPDRYIENMFFQNISINDQSLVSVAKIVFKVTCKTVYLPKRFLSAITLAVIAYVFHRKFQIYCVKCA